MVMVMVRVRVRELQDARPGWGPVILFPALGFAAFLVTRAVGLSFLTAPSSIRA